MVKLDALVKLRLGACVATVDQVLHPIPCVYGYGLIVDDIMECHESLAHGYNFLKEGASLLW